MNAKANNKEQGQTPPPGPSENAKSFSADVSRLLDIVANALYTNHDVFLRELISNAADACDRLRYDSITESKPD
jgi:HSP90 family molecular chaperone